MANIGFTHSISNNCLQLNFSGDLTVRSGDEIKELLAGVEAKCTLIEAAITEAEEMDLAFIQLLIAFARHASDRNGVTCQLSIVSNPDQKKILVNSGFDKLLNIK